MDGELREISGKLTAIGGQLDMLISIDDRIRHSLHEFKMWEMNTVVVCSTCLTQHRAREEHVCTHGQKQPSPIPSRDLVGQADTGGFNRAMESVANVLRAKGWRISDNTNCTYLINELLTLIPR